MMVQQMKVVVLCDAIAEQDDRVSVLHKKERRLVTSTKMMEWSRLTEIYLIFIDSDDYIHPEMIQSLYEQLIQEDADVSSCGVMNVYANDESPQSAKSGWLFCLWFPNIF